jgi:hypothetical protein
VPDDRAVGRLAELEAALGVAGLLTLALMYAIEVPNGGPYVFGTTNDVLGGLADLVLVLLLLALGPQRRPDVPGPILTSLAVLSGAVGAASSFLLLAHAIDFVLSSVVSVLALGVQCGWLLAFGLLHGARYARRVRRVALIAGGGTITGLAVVGLAFLLPGAPPLQVSLYVVGGVLGAAGWVAIPLFWHLLGRSLRMAGAAVHGLR